MKIPVEDLPPLFSCLSILLCQRSLNLDSFISVNFIKSTYTQAFQQQLKGCFGSIAGKNGENGGETDQLR
jgi:hypothetical protein